MAITQLQTPCRVWRGTTHPKGYGLRQVGGKQTRVHRWVMAQIHGWEALDGKVVMHLCDNPGCFRYDHLRIGTQAENLRDMRDKGRHGNQNVVKTHCKRGHPFDDENTYIDRGKRGCRSCGRIRQQRYLLRKNGEMS